MSVAETSRSAATERLTRAIASTSAAPKPDQDSSPLPTRRASRATSSDAERGAGEVASRPVQARGAAAAPDAASGAEAADQGAADVMGTGQPGTGRTRQVATGSHATTPYEASMDSYEAAGAQAGDAPDHAAAYDAAMAETAGGGDVAGTGAWSPQWQQTFEQLELAPADIEYLAQSGYGDDELYEIAMALDSVAPIDPNDPYARPIEGVDAGSAASANGPTPEDVGAMDPAAASAWSPEWAQKFTGVMQDMGMSDADIREQLAGVESQPVSEEQLQTAYTQMQQAIGDFDDEWRTKFTDVMTELDTPADEMDQVLQQLAGGGMTEAQLAEAYQQMQDAKPGWSDEWSDKFRALQIPDDMLKQLEESKAPASALEQQYDQLIETKIEYKRDGRLEKLEDAGASNEELWGVMLQGTEGEDFDKVVEQIHSAHVPAWKRIGSFALNLVPGVYALQFVTGKDWVTGEKIDRSNPLNIVGAVASGFAGFTAVRSAVAGVQGLTAANAAAQATKAAAGGAALADAVTGTSALSQGSFKAMQAAGLVSKFDKGLKFTDYLKSAIPIVNRFGEAGRLSAFGRGYYQSMQLTAGMAALKATAEGGAVVDKGVKSSVLAELKQGKSVQDAVSSVRGSTVGTSGGFSLRAQDVVRDGTRYGFLQGGVGKAGEGNRIIRGSGNFNLNPFKSTAGIAETATEGVYSLGKGVNFGTNAGLAQGMGVVRGANMVSNPGLYASAAAQAEGANRLMNGANAEKLAGLKIGDDVQRITTMNKTAEWAQKLGVTSGGRFRSLMQIGGGGSGRAVNSVAGIVENGGNTGYRVARYAGNLGQRYASYAAVPIVGGAAVGMTGKQMQPAWEYFKNRSEIQAEEAAQREVAEQEAAELERLYAEQQASQQAAAGGGAAQDPYAMQDPYAASSQYGATADPYAAAAGDPYAAAAATGASADPYAGATGEAAVYVDPNTGFYVDPQTGLMADPRSGMVYDQQGNVVANINQPAA